MDDYEIVELYLNRDETAISHTKVKYGAYLQTVAYNILNDTEDSEESVNDTYLAAWNSIPPNIPEKLKLYLGKITRRLSIDIYRKRHRYKRLAGEFAVSLSELGECCSSEDSPEQSLDAEILGEKLSAFLRGVSDDARRVFIGRYYYLDPIKAVAEYCGMSEAKAKSLLFRTRQKLKEFLAKEGYEV